ncbi:diacylglycerol kinase [Aliiroseovarius sp.]|uniref:diacylglycerol kinase n=1 Tax=Aliiroseovarius sp. TaxID=1872442 RepID=UPI003BAC866B
MALRNTIHREWTRFKWRCIWSWRGWLDCWHNEKSIMQWVVANVISAGLAMVIDLTGGERALILALGILVLAAELMNTAVERTVDYISTAEHDLARRAKDLASATVAVTAIAAGVAWVAVLVG